MISFKKGTIQDYAQEVSHDQDAVYLLSDFDDPRRKAIVVDGQEYANTEAEPFIITLTNWTEDTVYTEIPSSEVIFAHNTGKKPYISYGNQVVPVSWAFDENSRLTLAPCTVLYQGMLVTLQAFIDSIETSTLVYFNIIALPVGKKICRVYKDDSIDSNWHTDLTIEDFMYCWNSNTPLLIEVNHLTLETFQVQNDMPMFATNVAPLDGENLQSYVIGLVEEPVYDQETGEIIDWDTSIYADVITQPISVVELTDPNSEGYPDLYINGMQQHLYNCYTRMKYIQPSQEWGPVFEGLLLTAIQRSTANTYGKYAINFNYQTAVADGTLSDLFEQIAINWSHETMPVLMIILEGGPAVLTPIGQSQSAFCYTFLYSYDGHLYTFYLTFGPQIIRIHVIQTAAESLSFDELFPDGINID